MSKSTRVDAASPSSLLEESRKLREHPDRLLARLDRLRLNKVLCDVVLCCGGQEFPCHRVVLASISSYFEAMFTTGMLESTQERVNVDGVEPDVLDMLVSFAYTSEVTISTANVQALIAAADFMDVTDIREACCDYMERNTTVNNCVEVHLLADKYSFERLKKSSMDYILEYFSVIYKQEAFLSVSVDKLTEILSSDHLSAPEEDMVFDAAILWLHTCTDRRLTFGEVLEHVRLALISPSYLNSAMESLDLDVVKESEGCRRFISEAKFYRSLSEAEDQCYLQSYRNSARPRRTTVIVVILENDPNVWSFDPLTKQWKILTRAPSVHFGMVASGSVIYVAGGGRLSEVSNQVWRYDLQHNVWSQMAHMKEARRDCGLVMLDGLVFAVAGVGPDRKVLKSVEAYDPDSNTWELLKSVDNPNFDYDFKAVVALDGLMYVLARARTGVYMYTYNPTTGEWTEVSRSHGLHYISSACTINGKIYTIGGQYIGDSKGEVQCYDPETNQWTMCSPCPQRSYSPPMAVVDGMIYVLRDNDVLRYCAETDTWEAVAEMPDGGYGHSCVSVRLRNDAASIISY